MFTLLIKKTLERKSYYATMIPKGMNKLLRENTVCNHGMFFIVSFSYHWNHWH